MLHGKKVYSIAGVAVLLVALLAYGASASGLFQEEQAFIPAEQVQAAIQTATAQEAGSIRGAFVEREEGTVMVEVFVRSGSAVRSVEVDAQTNQVVEVEDGMEGHYGGTDEEMGSISAQAAVRSIQAAVAEQPGDVGGFIVEQEEGTVMAEVFVKASSGTVYSVEVDANTGEVVEVEEGTEEHIE